MQDLDRQFEDDDLPITMGFAREKTVAELCSELDAISLEMVGGERFSDIAKEAIALRDTQKKTVVIFFGNSTAIVDQKSTIQSVIDSLRYL